MKAIILILYHASIGQRYNYQLGLFRMTRAAMTPGTHPQKVSKSTIKKDPQPFPITDKGGNIIASKTLQKLMSQILCPR